MRAVFADTLYWVAIVKPNDSWGELAKQAKSALGNVRILTTDEVLTEFMATLSSGGEKLRLWAVKMVRAILDNPNVKVLPQSRDSFLHGVDLYEERLDKEYSLVDCISMNSMRQEKVSDVLTNDNHFVQEGFNILIKRNK
jgi:uncharacterized protein